MPAGRWLSESVNIASSRFSAAAPCVFLQLCHKQPAFFDRNEIYFHIVSRKVCAHIYTNAQLPLCGL
jgi:hypothetical protein